MTRKISQDYHQNIVREHKHGLNKLKKRTKSYLPFFIIASYEHLSSVSMVRLFPTHRSNDVAPSSPIGFSLKTIHCRVVLLRSKHFESAMTPRGPILFFSKFSIFSVPLNLSACARDSAPSLPMLLCAKLSSVKQESFLSAYERCDCRRGIAWSIPDMGPPIHRRPFLLPCFSDYNLSEKLYPLYHHCRPPYHLLLPMLQHNLDTTQIIVSSVAYWKTWWYE